MSFGSGDDALSPRLEGHFGDVRGAADPDGLSRSRLDQLPSQAQLAASGLTATGGTAATGNSGQLDRRTTAGFKESRRVGRLRMYGDSIAVPQAVAFIKAYLAGKGNR